MQLSLIGMSGSGKSTWSERLSKQGFQVFHCDDLIAEKLGGQLKQPDGRYVDVGEWMGFPHEPAYKERETRYLQLEKEVLMEILGRLESGIGPGNGRVVVDTTGSVIYTGESALNRLRKTTRVVHLSTPPEIRELMLNAYLANRRPVLWRDYFEPTPDEALEETLARCYPKLLEGRETLYTRCADITIDYTDHSREESDVTDFLNRIEENSFNNSGLTPLPKERSNVHV